MHNSLQALCQKPEPSVYAADPSAYQNLCEGAWLARLWTAASCWAFRLCANILGLVARRIAQVAKQVATVKGSRQAVAWEPVKLSVQVLRRQCTSSVLSRLELRPAAAPASG